MHYFGQLEAIHYNITIKTDICNWQLYIHVRRLKAVYAQ